MSVEENKRNAAAFLRGIGAGAIPDELVTEDFSAWTAASGEMPGQRYRGGVKLLSTIFRSPISIEILDTIAEGDRVALRVQSHGPLTSGEEYRNDYVFLFHFRDGRVARLFEYFNVQIVAEKLAPLMRAAASAAAPASS